MNIGTLLIHKTDKTQAIVAGEPFAKFYQEYNPHGWADYGTACMAVRIKYVKDGTERIVKVSSVKRNFEVVKPATTPARPFGSAVDTEGRTIEWSHE